jgi:hypothetical protein
MMFLYVVTLCRVNQNLHRWNDTLRAFNVAVRCDVQYKCLFKFSVCYDKEPFERNQQEKFGTEVNYKLYCTVYAKYFFKKYLNMR